MKMFKILKYTSIATATGGLTAWLTKPTNESLFPPKFEENFLFKAMTHELIHTYVKFDDYTLTLNLMITHFLKSRLSLDTPPL